MVYFAYLKREYGLAKIGVVVLGTVILGLGCHSYFSSPWVKNDVHKICNLLKNETTAIPLSSTCPDILLEKVFIVVTLFCFTLSALALLGNLFSKQLSQGFFKLADIGYNTLSGILVIISGSLFLYSGVAIDALFTEIGGMDSTHPCMANITRHHEYQLYEEKVAAGSLSIIQGVVYFVVAILLFLR